MVDYTQSKTGNARGIGFVIAAVVVVLVLLYALFAGGSVETTADPASVGAAETAPAAQEEAPIAPTVPASE